MVSDVIMRTLVKFGVPKTSYSTTNGVSNDIELLTVRVGFDDNGNEIKNDCFYCNWHNSYGAIAIQQQADGVVCPARVRMPFVQAVYDALQSKDVKVYKNGIADKEHTYTLISAADNYCEQSKTLEFNVKKYEVK